MQLQKVKRYYTTVNNTRRGIGRATLPLIKREYETLVKSHRTFHKVGVILHTDGNINVELFSNQDHPAKVI